MTDTTKAKAPSLIAYHVREGKEKSFFTRIGVAWPNSDGNGFNIRLDGLVPLDGRITVRVASEKKD